MKIFEANKPMLKDPDKIYPGQVLRIPAAERVLPRNLGNEPQPARVISRMHFRPGRIWKGNGRD
jgi:hypothetical protein